jgi:uncharacterized protein DUF6502
MEPLMAESATSTAAESFIFFAVRRMASFLVPLGFGLGDFLRITKSAFVSAATEHISSRGSRVSTSQIAVITGLSRSEVADIRANRGSSRPGTWGRRTERVMHGWFSDPDFVDERGRPKPLRSNGPNSFRRLVKRFGGDVTPNAVLRELIAGGMVRLGSVGEYEAIGRYYRAPADSTIDFHRLAIDLDAFFASVVQRGTTESPSIRHVAVRFSGAVAVAVRRNVAIRIERFLDALSEYLHTAADPAVGKHQERGEAELLHVLIAYATDSDRADSFPSADA